MYIPGELGVPELTTLIGFRRVPDVLQKMHWFHWRASENRLTRADPDSCGIMAYISDPQYAVQNPSRGLSVQGINCITY